MFFIHNFASFFLKSAPKSYKLQAYQSLALSCLIQCKMWLSHSAVNVSPESLLQLLLYSTKSSKYTLQISGFAIQDRKQSIQEPADEKILINGFLEVRVGIGCQERLKKEGNCRGY